MGVKVRQKIKGKGQPYWIFINHNGKRKSIKVGDRRAAEATAGRIREKLSKGNLKIADVSNQLGHHSVKLTLNTYYHWIPGKQKNEVDELDNLHLPAPHAHPKLKKDEKI